MYNLILVRHGQSQWNLENRFTGWYDSELTKQGIEEAQQEGSLIKNLNINFNFAFTSFQQRAILTLDEINKKLDLSIKNIFNLLKNPNCIPLVQKLMDTRITDFETIMDDIASILLHSNYKSLFSLDYQETLKL